MNDLKDREEEQHIREEENTSAVTTTIEGDRIDSVEDYILENSQMQQDRLSSQSSHMEHAVEEYEEEEEEDEEEEAYERDNYSKEPPKYINGDEKVFQAKMQNILQEMKMKEIIRDKSGERTFRQTNAHTVNSRPLSPESTDLTSDHSYDGYYMKHEEEAITVEEVERRDVTEDENNERISTVDDRESSTQYELEPETEDIKHAESQEQPKGVECTFEESLSESMTHTSEDSDAQSRLIYNAVPAMNSKTNDAVNFVQEQIETLKFSEEPKVNVTYPNNHSATAFYDNLHINNTERLISNSPTNPTSTPMQPTSQYVTNSRSRPIRPIYQSSATLSNQPKPAHHNSSSAMHYPIRRAYSPKEEPISPPKSIVHIGSQVISEQSGPSLTISLRRPNSERHWGFTFYGGAEHGCPPFVNKVTINGLANRAGVEVGDVIVSICNSLTVGKTYEQVKAEMLRAGNELDLILIRRGVDMNKVMQIAPHLMPTSSFNQQTSFDSDTSSQRKLSTRSLTRGRSFRPIQTKSLRILEQQLSIGESTGNPVVKVRQVAAEPRGITPPAYNTSFTKAYGQNVSSQMYIPDRQIKPQQFRPVSMTTVIHPTHSPQGNQPQYNSYEYDRTTYNISPNQWVTTQPIQLWNNTGNNYTTTVITNRNNNRGNYADSNVSRQSYQRTENTNWMKATPSNQYTESDYHHQNTYTINSYSEQRDSSSTRSVPIYPATYSPYRY
ncbi:unnamed protein product [Heterobilharzia americana]|nr:unnamed protein product [Heterobilharzia americana]